MLKFSPIMLLNIAQKSYSSYYFKYAIIDCFIRVTYSYIFITDCFIRMFHKVIVLLEYFDPFPRHATLTDKDSQPYCNILLITLALCL